MKTTALRLAGPAFAAGLVVAVLLPRPADGLINPKFTVVDLTQGSGQVLVLRVSAPKDGRLTAQVVEALAGDAPAEKEFVFDFNDAQDLAEDKVSGAFGGAPTALAVMCVQKKKQEGALVGALEIGTAWMGLTQGATPKEWKLDHDPSDLETVWGGSARQLVPAIRYVLSDPRANFPVVSAMSWGRDLSLGKLTGPAHGCLVTADGILVLSSGGDHVYQPGTKDAPPVDVTDKLGLRSKSKALACGDFSGAGRLDLASWDGAKLWLLRREADGRFAPPAGGFELPECASLSALDGGLVAGTATGVTLLKPDGNGGWTARRLETGTAPGALGPGGICAVADFNHDGAPDILQVFAKDLVFYAGRRESGAFAAPVVTPLEGVRNPAAVLCGDYDGDGQLDLLVAGDGGALLLSREGGGPWKSITTETGELGAASGLGRGEALVVAACPSDLNGDGRQCAALFQAAASPNLFFNRGFACFGVARSLQFADTKLAATDALGGGQMTGTLCDLNGDGAPDLLAVDRQQEVWVLFCEPKEPRRFQLTAETAGKDPLTVTVSFGQRTLGMWVVCPGEPATIGLPRAGKATLRWQTADGTEVTRDVVVTAPARVKL